MALIVVYKPRFIGFKFDQVSRMLNQSHWQVSQPWQVDKDK